MKRIIKYAMFPVLGLGSLIWFLIRVVPKPSRATYPCMKAAAPLASSFVIYLLGIFSSITFFKKAKRFFAESRYVFFAMAIIACFSLGAFTLLSDSHPVKAVEMAKIEGPNQPMGEGQGVKPGRVAWVYNPDATDEDCPNTRNNYWSSDDYTDPDVVDQMVSQALQTMTGTSSDAAAWQAMFQYHNQKNGKGAVNYAAGEKIAIKINLNGVSQGGDKINTSPQVTHAVLDQLVNVVGVAQSDISIGDPNSNFPDLYWDKCHTDFPNVHYYGSNSGRTPIKRSANKVIFSSDGTVSDWLPQSYLDATYLINLPVFKKHHRAGISITSKNHFGTFAPFNGGAWHWHFSLPAPDGAGDVSNGEYGVYRCFVDFMGFEHLGKKTVLYLVDGLWSSTNWGHPPIKWSISPFNGDYPNSIFASMDPVAVQSVCFDFLYEEFDQNHPTEGPYDPRDNSGPFPHYAGTEDFLHQAATSDNWPAGLTYDPENDGTPIASSLGVHEHWNNAIDKMYTKDMGTGNGIELMRNFTSSAVPETGGQIITGFKLNQNYPNPFNPSTNISYDLSQPSHVKLVVFQADGREVKTLFMGSQAAGTYEYTWDGRDARGVKAASGVYFYRIFVSNGTHSWNDVRKMVLSR